MASILFGTPDYLQATDDFTPTVSGGSFETDLPATNMATRALHTPARTTDAAVANTVCTWDLKTSRTIRMAALLSNLSSAGTVRVRGFSAVPVLDSLDFSAGWGEAGTPIRTAAALICDDGVPLDLLEDDSAAAIEQYTRNITFAGDGVKVLSFRVAPGDATNAIVSVANSTTTATVLRVSITQSGGLPVINVTTGTLISQSLIGDGPARRVVVATTSVTSANTHQIRVSPATDVSADVTDVGDTYFGDFMAWDSASDRLVYDSGYQLAIPSGADTEYGVLNAWAQLIADEDFSARYVRVNVNDTANADGYIDFKKLVVCGGYQPEVNVSYGAGLSFETATTSAETRGGARVYDARRTRRTMDGVLEMMSATEAWGTWFGLRAWHGLDEPLFVVFDPDDTTYRHLHGFLAVFSQLDGLQHSSFLRHKGAFAMREEL